MEKLFNLPLMPSRDTYAKLIYTDAHKKFILLSPVKGEECTLRIKLIRWRISGFKNDCDVVLTIVKRTVSATKLILRNGEVKFDRPLHVIGIKPVIWGRRMID